MHVFASRMKNQQPTLYDRVLYRLKSWPVVIVILLVFIAVTGLATFTDALSKLASAFGRQHRPSVMTGEHTSFRPLSEKTKLSVIERLTDARSQNGAGTDWATFYVQPGNSDRMKLGVELESLFHAAGFRTHLSPNAGEIYQDPPPSVEMLVNSEHPEYSREIQRILLCDCFTVEIIEKPYSGFSKDEIEIRINGDPVFSIDGKATFK